MRVNRTNDRHIRRIVREAMERVVREGYDECADTGECLMRAKDCLEEARRANEWQMSDTVRDGIDECISIIDRLLDRDTLTDW